MLGRLRNRLFGFAHHVEMKANGLRDQGPHFLDGVAGRHATRQVRNHGAIVALVAINLDEKAHVLHSSSWAWLIMEDTILGCKVLLGLPATVTVPGLVG